MKNFGEAFKTTIMWMMKDKYGKEIEDHINGIIINKKGLEKDPNYSGAFKILMEAIATNSWFLKKPKNFDDRISDFLKRYGNDFWSPRARKEIIKIVGNSQINRKKIESLLQYSTIREFTQDLYKLAKKGETNVLGEKGRDDYLRSVGYWDRIPIDRHEKRFLLRTGIYHAYASKDKGDPLETDTFQEVLTRFCKELLSGFTINVNGKIIDLMNPGFVDVFIWSYCAEKRYNICGEKPRCEECKLRETCLYPSINLSLKSPGLST